MVAIFNRIDVEKTFYRALVDGDVETVQFLLNDAWVSVDSRFTFGNTPLIIASANNHVELVEFLLAFGALIDCPNDEGDTALITAAHRNHTVVFKLLIRSDAAIHSANRLGFTALDYAVSRNNLRSVQLLLEKDGESKPLAREAYVRTFFAAGINNFLEIVNVLLDYGVDVNSRNPEGSKRTLLMVAAEIDNLALAKLLLMRGADVDAIDKRGKTAISFAYSTSDYQDSNWEIIELLRKHGADD